MTQQKQRLQWVALSAAYLLWLVHRVFYGQPSEIFKGIAEDKGKMPADLTRREWAVMLPILALIVWIGIYPKPMLERIEPAVRNVVVQYHSAVKTHLASLDNAGRTQPNREAAQ